MGSDLLLPPEKPSTHEVPRDPLCSGFDGTRREELGQALAPPGWQQACRVKPFARSASWRPGLVMWSPSCGWLDEIRCAAPDSESRFSDDSTVNTPKKTEDRIPKGVKVLQDLVHPEYGSEFYYGTLWTSFRWGFVPPNHFRGGFWRGSKVGTNFFR